ncbi:MAG: anthrone oxygenase family protein [Pseudomonadota bacterium]
METAPDIVRWLIILSTLGSGMMAGLFVAFSTFIMKALASIPEGEGMRAMQAINRFIIRPSFLVVFLGTGALLIASCLLIEKSHPSFLFLVFATLAYLVTCLISTIAFNVPLNNQLESFDSTSDDGLDFWQHYLDRWVKWNHVRSVACLGATILLAFALSSL